MKKYLILLASALLLAGSAFAQEPGKAQFNWYGFIRNYFIYDSHESSAGTEDLYYYMPVDSKKCGTANFVALTSRIGLDVKGYEVDGYKVGAKMEADFYCKSGTTAILRMRQAYLTLAKNNRSWKIGQAWHPLAADLPDIFSLESGAPFGAFSRTPQVNFEYSPAKWFSVTAAGIWEMQYVNVGPNGASAEYIKRSKTPEAYLGINFKRGANLLRLGVDVLSISPMANTRLTTANLFQYGQFQAGNWLVKEKVTYMNDGSHLNMVGGYGISHFDKNDGIHTFSATRNLSTWATITYKKGRLVPSLFLGYIQNFGTPEEIVNPTSTTTDKTFWAKNSADQVAYMYRIQPELVYNLGKVQFGAEYMMTSVEYGTPDNFKKAVENLHEVVNHRIQFIVKYTF